MTGQDAVNSAKAFNEALELDGDARGGAALSVKKVTGVPIKFIGTGETLDALEEFHPDRMAGRILGMGDMLSLIEQAQQKFDQDELQRQQERLAKGEFTLDDFRKQMSQIKRLGSIGKLMSFIPGMGQLSKMMGDMNVDGDDQMQTVGGIIDSMTQAERRNPKIIDQSRRERIAKGAGVAPHQINELVKMFMPMAEMMKSMAGKGGRDQMRMMSDLMQNMQKNPTGMPAIPKKGTGKRLSNAEKAKAKKEREKESKKKRKK
jgi:signal recognition particle subunit SRP54